MTDPATDYRKEIEATSPEITGLLVKHKDNATMQVIKYANIRPIPTQN
jgi:hypothetical protein